MYEQVYEPVAGSLALSALVAAIPIIVLFVLLAGIRVAAHQAEPEGVVVRVGQVGVGIAL